MHISNFSYSKINAVLRCFVTYMWNDPRIWAYVTVGIYGPKFGGAVYN